MSLVLFCILRFDSFQECVSAIDKSVTCDYEVRNLKLLIRKAKALLHLRKMIEASRVIDKAETVFTALCEKKSEIGKFNMYNSEPCLPKQRFFF